MGTIAEMKKQADASKPFKVEELSCKKLEQESKYSKCPRCWKDGVLQHWTKEKLMTLPNVSVVKVKEYYSGKDRSVHCNFETYYDCQQCGERLTVEDWCKAYTKKYTAEK